MIRLIIAPCPKRTGTAPGKTGIGSLVLATYLWATVLALGVWDYYIIKFPPCHLPKIYQEVLMPVVRITCPNRVGSGVVIGSRVNGLTSSNYVLTAAHVVGNQGKVQVHIYDYELGVVIIKSAHIIITDTYKDLALLRLNPSNLSNLRLRSAKLADRNYRPHLFTPIYAVGCSLGLDPRPSQGIVSVTSVSPWQRWEISAPILPGNSGGGVFLKDTHELIGIVVWVRLYRGQLITTMTGIVPINQVYNFLEECGAVIPLGAGLRCRSVYEFLKTTPLMNCEEHKSEGLTRWSDRGSECAIGTRGPGGPTLPMKGGEKSWHK